FGAQSMRSAQRRRSTSAIEPSCCYSPPPAFATASSAPFSCRISTGEVFVRRTKGKRDRVAPLLEETGAALADYILRARPKVDSPYLFLSFTPPLGPFKCASPVSRIVRKRLRHGGIELGRVGGAHLLRHSLATQLVRQRRPINEVADLLGHQSINTTALYVKVATSQLAEVALPFPGGVA
ncbi:tyrosine-type recombinase/integrase, partial [Mesorhizobium sp.]|uniref:tyrosine-type recombinase/integrase n=1 Tax=Mesorhizobium sp. TaxID=1871066 RepID=UPI0025B80F4B